MAFMAAASPCFSGTAVTCRAAMQDGLPTIAAPFARGVFSLIIIAPFLWRMGLLGLATRRPWAMAGRCGAGLFSFRCRMLALMPPPPADAVSIAQARPIWAIFLAASILGAAPSGFLGVLVIAGPTGALSWGVLAAVGAGVGGALALITFRALAPPEPPMRVIAWHAIASVAFWAPFAAWFWVTPTACMHCCCRPVAA